MENNMNILAIILMLIMIVSFTLFTIFIFKNWFNIFRSTGGYKKIKGKCVDYDKYYRYGSGGDDEYRGWRYIPIVSYKVNNCEYLIKSKVTYGNKIFLKNKKFTVLYDPDNPNHATLKNQQNLFLVVIVFFLISIILMSHFLINDLILENTPKVYSFDVYCNYPDGPVYYFGKISKEAKNAEEAKNLISNQYKNLQCFFKTPK